MHLHGRRALQILEVLQDTGGDALEVLPLVQVLHVRRCEMQLEVRGVVLEEVIVRNLVGDGNSCQNGSLVRPATRYVTHSVSPSAEHKQRHVEGLHVLHAFGVAVQGEVEAAEAVTCERVSAALQDDGGRSVHLHDLVDDRSKYGLVGVIVNAFVEGNVHAIVLARFRTDIADVAGARKEVSVLVKGHRHHAISHIKRFFNSITVMDVNIYI